MTAVGPLSLGCAPLGGQPVRVSDAEAREALDTAWNMGIRAFDTAPFYGSGLSELRVGAALAGRPRAAYELATKVGRVLVPRAPGAPPRNGAESFAGGLPFDPVFDFSRDGVRRSLDSSLERLGTDRVDVAHVHDPDRHLAQAIAEAIPALVELRQEGAVGAVGVGMNVAAPLARIVREAPVDCVLIAGRYTLLDRSAADELLPACQAAGIRVIAGGVFNSGILADPHAGAFFHYAPAPPEVLERARRMQAICARHGVTLRAAAVQFACRHPAIDTVLVGARSASEVRQAVEALAEPIPDALWDELGAAG